MRLWRVHHHVEIERKSADDGRGDDEPPFSSAAGGQCAQYARQNRACKGDGRAPFAIGRHKDAGKQNDAGNSCFCGPFHPTPPGLRSLRRSAEIRISFKPSALSLRPVPKVKHGPRRYLRRDFTFALDMTANGGATVINTRMNTITKPNMNSPTLFGFSVEHDSVKQDKDGAPRR